MNKLSLMGSCQQVVMINLSAIKSRVKKTFRWFQNSHGKTILTVPFTFVLYSKIRAVVFAKQLITCSRRRAVWGQFAFEAPVFTTYIPAFYGAKRPYHYTRFTVVIHLSSFVEDSEKTEDHRALPPLRRKNTGKMP